MERLQTLRRHQPTGPLMCSEFWDGWFDHWREHHHTTDTQTAVDELDALLSAGASVNIYMFHGGTNFGFTNGANHKGIYKSLVTSYDYDAPMDEAGRPTAKYRHSDAPVDNPAPPHPAPEFSAALTFVVRALVADSVAVLIARRPGTAPARVAATVPRHVLAPLGDDDVRAMLAVARPDSARSPAKPGSSFSRLHRARRHAALRRADAEHRARSTASWEGRSRSSACGADSKFAQLVATTQSAGTVEGQAHTG